MNRSKWLIICAIAIAILLLGWVVWNFGLNVYAIDVPVTASPTDCEAQVRFAVIGDYGEAGQPEADVAALVDSWVVDFIVTVGDNNYPDGEASTIDRNIGQYYQNYIHPYQGEHGAGATENRFFPAMGNHDWDTGSPQPYLDYFTLPGNERYYDIARGPVHLFVLDSDPRETGRKHTRLSAGRLVAGEYGRRSGTLAARRLASPALFVLSLARRKRSIAVALRSLGRVILGGHEHFYERAYVDGIPQFVVGLAGKWKGINPIHRFDFTPIPGSQVRYNRDYGALLVVANDQCINFSYYNRDKELIDSYTMKQ